MLARVKKYISFFLFCCSIFQGYSFFTDVQDVFAVAGNIWKSVVMVSKGIKTVGNIIDEASEEHCIYYCPDGKKPNEKNRYHTPSSNGCGSFGINFPEEYMPVGELTSCCNKHDICYDTCNKDKDKCDIDFKNCLYDICKKYSKKLTPEIIKLCKIAAKGMYTGTLAVGCSAYKDSQAKACYCRPNKRREL